MSILPIIDVLVKVIDKVIPDPQAKMQLQLELAKLADAEAAREHEEILGQIATNTEEAKSSNLFVAGWRPAVGWIGATALGYSFVLEPLVSWIATVVFGYHGTFPELNTEALMTLMMGMLGFHGVRAYEKVKGVSDTEIVSSATPSLPSPVPATPKKKVLGIPWPF